jgi:GTP cyclohydrolase I
MRQIPQGFHREDLQGQTKSDKDFGPLQWVGMKGIQLPVRFAGPSDVFTGGVVSAMATVDAFVSLDKSDQRGIHMSRVYSRLQNAFLSVDAWSLSAIESLGSELLATQQGASDRFRLQMSLALPVLQQALVSDGKGWRSYPLNLQIIGCKDSINVAVETELLYSSTCPCSAGLARELNYEAFQQRFKDQETVATEDVLGFLKSDAALAGTPHAQRSLAEVRFQLASGFEDVLAVTAVKIKGLEQALATPVQTLVKREDEKEFARLNAENLMFCEDAARRLRDYFISTKEVSAFECKVIHQESLHPHDAVAVVTGGEMADFK